jgi:type IV pilus assembly protein PilA
MNINQSLKNNKSAGFSIIELLIVVVVIGIIAAIAVPNLLKSRRAANEASAITTVRIISREEVSYRFSSGTDAFGTIAELYAGKFIEDSIGVPPNIKIGYAFSVATLPASGGNPPRYTIQANPALHSLDNSLTGTGSRNFGANESGVIYQTLDNTPVSFDDITRVPTGSTIILQN